MTDDAEPTLDLAGEHARRFGARVRERRKAQGLTQDELALAAGVGRRFVIELEMGKPTCTLGKALVVADVLGVGFDAGLVERADPDGPMLPDILDDEI